MVNPILGWECVGERGETDWYRLDTANDMSAILILGVRVCEMYRSDTGNSDTVEFRLIIICVILILF